MSKQPEALECAHLLGSGFTDSHTRGRAAAELRRLHAVNEALLSALGSCVSLLDHAGINTSLGYCCCGDQIEGHPSAYTAGHSPVDAGDYAASQAIAAARAAIQLATAEATQG